MNIVEFKSKEQLATEDTQKSLKALADHISNNFEEVKFCIVQDYFIDIHWKNETKEYITCVSTYSDWLFIKEKEGIL